LLVQIDRPVEDLSSIHHEYSVRLDQTTRLRQTLHFSDSRTGGVPSVDPCTGVPRPSVHGYLVHADCLALARDGGKTGERSGYALSIEYGTYKAVKTRFLASR